MADSPQEIIQNVVLRLEEQIQGQGEILGAVQRNIDALNKAQKILSKHSGALKASSKASEATGKSLSGIASSLGIGGKAVGGFSKSLMGSSKVMGLVGKSAFAMGGAISASLAIATAGISAIIAAIAGLAKMVIGLAQSGEQFTRFAVATGKGTSAVRELRQSYENLLVTSDKVLVSITDVTRAMSDFASQGFAQMQMAAQSGTQEMIASMQNAFAQTGLGKDFAAEMTSNLTKAFGDNLAGLRQFQAEWNNAAGDMRAQIAVLEGAKWIDRQTVAQGIGALTTALEVSEGKADNAIQASVIYRNVMDQLNAVIENVNQALLQAFGGDIAALIGKLGDAITWVVKGISNLAMTLNVWWAGAKAVFANIGIAAWSAFEVVLAAGGYAVGGLALAFGKLLDWLPFTDIGEGVMDWANSLIDDANAVMEDGLSPNFVNVEKEMEKAAAGWMESQQGVAKAVEDAKSPLSDAERQLSIIRDRMGVILQETSNWSKQLSMAGEAAATTAKLIELVGARVSVAGQDMDMLHWGNINESIRAGVTLLQKAGETAIADANRQIELIKRVRDEKLAAARTDDERAAISEGYEQQINKAIEERNNLIQKNLEGYQAIDAAFDQAVAKQKAQLEIASAQRSLFQRQLDISKALYGTPALGVQSLLRVTKQMQIEKQLMQDQLENTKAVMAALEEQGVPASQLQGYRKRVLELEEKIASKTAEQLQMVKELRDGYLDAVQAQAFAAGEFEKIIVTQEKNLGMALEKGLVKSNYLLGQVGEAADKARAMPYQFGAEGFGDMRGMDGREFGPKEIKQRMEVALENVEDPTMRAAIRESMETVAGIQDEAAQMYSQATETQVSAINDQIEATDDLTTAMYSAVDAFANKASTATATVGGIKGGVNESVVAGEAAAQAVADRITRRKQRTVIGVVQEEQEPVPMPKVPQAPSAAPPRRAAPAGAVPATPESPDIFQEVVAKESELIYGLKDALSDDAAEFVRFMRKYNSAGRDLKAQMAALEEIEGISRRDLRRAKQSLTELNEMIDEAGRWRFETPEKPEIPEVPAPVTEGPEPAKIKAEPPDLKSFTLKAPELPDELGDPQKLEILQQHIMDTYVASSSDMYYALTGATADILRAQKEHSENIRKQAEAKVRELGEVEISGEASAETAQALEEANAAVEASSSRIESLQNRRADIAKQFAEMSAKYGSATVNLLSNAVLNNQEQIHQLASGLSDIERTKGKDSPAYKEALKEINELSIAAGDLTYAWQEELWGAVAERFEEQTNLQFPDLGDIGGDEGIYLDSATIRNIGAKVAARSDQDLREFVKKLESDKQDKLREVNETMAKIRDLAESGDVDEELDRQHVRLLAEYRDLSSSIGKYKDVIEQVDAGIPVTLLDRPELLKDFAEASKKDSEAAGKRAMLQSLRENSEARNVYKESLKRLEKIPFVGAVIPALRAMTFEYETPDTGGVVTEIPTEVTGPNLQKLAVDLNLPSRLPDLNLGEDALKNLQETIYDEMHKLNKQAEELGGATPEIEKLKKSLLQNVKSVREQLDKLEKKKLAERDLNRAREAAAPPTDAAAQAGAAGAAPPDTKPAGGDGAEASATEMDATSAKRAVNEYRAAKAFQDEQNRVWIEWKDDERKRHMTLVGDAVPDSEVQAPRVKLADGSYAQLEEDIRSFSRMTDEQGKQWLSWTDEAGEKQRTLLEQIPEQFVDQTVEVPGPGVVVHKPKVTTPVEKGIEENAKDIVRKANEENKRAVEKAGKEAKDGSDYPQLELRDAIAEREAKEAQKEEKKFQESGQRIDELGFASDMVARGRRDVSVPVRMSARDSKAYLKAQAEAKKHKLKTREENAEIYDEQQATKAAEEQIKQTKEAVEKAKEHTPRHAGEPQKGTEPSRPGGGPQAQEDTEKPPTHATGGHELTHGTQTKRGRKTGGVGGGGMGTSGDRVIEAAKLMKKAAENLILIADDIDALATADSGVDYSSHPGLEGGSTLNTG